ncbi:MAG: PEP-CTERM sorting domain-containing protein [Phycisphaerae bacterium]|nr:PEP-CTERM sorting domain-containing protein [Phycisphaerae bacterium]
MLKTTRLAAIVLAIFTLFLFNTEAASGQSTLLGSEPRSGNSGILYCLDRATGTGQEIGTFDPYVPAMNGLAHDRINDILYGISPHFDQLFRINPATAQVTPIGQPGDLGASNANGLAYDPIGGVLYGTGNNANTLFTIDVDTGIGSTVGTIGGGFSNVEGLGFDADTGTLYGLAVGEGGSEIYYHGRIIVIDPATGGATALGDVMTSERIWRGLTFDPETNGLIACGGSGLYWIDPADGSASYIGGMYVQGLAVIPEPATLSLLAVGAVALIRRRKK